MKKKKLKNSKLKFIIFKNDIKNITMDIIQQNPEKPWNWISLSLNKFTLSREELEKSRNSIS